MTPDEVIFREFPTTLKVVSRVWFSKIPPKLLQVLNNSTRVLFIILLRGKDTKANWPSFQHSTGRRRITKTVRHPIQYRVAKVDEAEDQVILTTFQAGLLLGDFFFLITKSPPKIVVELLRKA